MNVLWTRRADGDMRAGVPAGAGVVAGAGLRGIAATRQVHGARVVAVEHAVDGWTLLGEADGLATRIPGVGLAVRVADCLPVAIGARGAVAMLHCGWRGLASGIIGEGVRVLRDLGATGELQGAIGPGAGRCCYEAGPEVHAAFGGRASARGNVDLKGEARMQLAAAGVGRIDDVGVCTLCGEDVFSHRGGDAERMAGIAWLSEKLPMLAER